MQQKRFVLALLISVLILFGWSYIQRRFFPTPIQQDSNTNSSTAQQQNPATASPSPQVSTAPASQVSKPETAFAPDTTPQRTITISTPLYNVKLDNRGAIIKSWIIKKNKENDRTLYSVAGNKNNPQQLELISPKGLERGEAPLRLTTVNGDAALDAALASRNYKVSGVDGGGGDVTLNLAPKESKAVEFDLHDDATGLDVIKKVIFNADNYNTSIEVKLSRGGQSIPQARLLVGPNIGDQGVSHYTFYSVAPEGIVATAEGQVQRIYAAAIHKAEEGWLFRSTRPEGADRKVVSGDIDWAGVGDTYFAMVAVPPKPTQGLEFRTTSYEHEVNGKKEEQYLITALVPIPTDGSQTQLYVGPKDHHLLIYGSQEISQVVGRKVDLEGSINYGFLSSMRRFLAVPILWSINALQKITGSYGVAIILFTIFIYSLFFPLKWRSSKAMKKAQKLAPRMKELQEKIKGMKQTDPRLKDLQMEQLRLMKEGNPLGGCLPLLIQMPFLFALYSAITISLDFRQAPFLWVSDLSSAEPTFIHILPILMAGSMIVLQLITPQPSADPLQRKMMAIGMPLFMLYVLWSAPAGLLVYWLVGNIVGFSQQFLINHLTKSEDDEEPQPPGGKKSQPPSPKKLSPARVPQA